MSNDDSPSVADVYDEIAESYASDYWDENLHQSELEFPATTGLLESVDLAGRRLLDAGCGSGVYTDWLLDHGAEVVATDVSEAMLEQTEALVGDDAEIHQADLREPLTFAEDGAFGGVVCAQVLDHVADIEDPLDEFARVLSPDGFLVLSVRHPLRNAIEYDDWRYFGTERRVEDWGVDMPHYPRPLAAIVNPLLTAGFQLETIEEPSPTQTFRERDPEEYERLTHRPQFLCLLARRL